MDEPTLVRRLTTIISIDVVGFSTMSARDEEHALELLRSGDVKLLIANSQTGGAETALVIAEAAKRSIPVLEFSETLPAGKTYLSWMQANIDALSEGLGA